MSDEKSLQELQDLIQQVLAAETDNLEKLAAMAGLDLAEDFAQADLRDTNLSEVILIEADLRGTDLRSANLKSANLRGGDLRGSDLIGANLTGADLRGANLRGANLRSADLKGIGLEGANLSDANLNNADLRGATNLSSPLLNPTTFVSKPNFLTISLIPPSFLTIIFLPPPFIIPTLLTHHLSTHLTNSPPFNPKLPPPPYNQSSPPPYLSHTYISILFPPPSLYPKSPIPPPLLYHKNYPPISFPHHPPPLSNIFPPSIHPPPTSLSSHFLYNKLIILPHIQSPPTSNPPPLHIPPKITSTISIISFLIHISYPNISHSSFISILYIPNSPSPP
jgi:hypothetical protein